MQVSMVSMYVWILWECFYNEDINYYFRINFAGFEQLINSLGGVTVYSDYDFDSKNETGYHFNQERTT